MKIRGRFIGILAVLGLLIALVPLATAGAVAGEVKLTGGEKGQYFSDQTGKNIVTIEIKDADLTPLRTGTARTDNGSSTSLNLTTYVVAGEKEVTERFAGGLNNPLCDIDPDDGADPVVLERPANDDERAMPGCNKGDAIALDDSGEVLGATAGDDDIDQYRFNLSGVARDSQSNSQAGVGDITSKDIISVAVNGRTAAASKEADNTIPDNIGNAPWFSIVEEGEGGEPGESGGGIVAIILHNIVPQDAGNSVSVTFKDTEFEFASTTPLDIDDTKVNFGGSVVGDSTGYTNATSRAGVTGATAATVTTGIDVSGYTIVTFAYDVEDKYAADKSMVTLSSTSAGDMRLAIEESSADSDTFTAKVAVFSQEDRGIIATAAGNVADNDKARTAPAAEANGIVEIDELIAALDNTGGTRSLRSRVQVAADAVGYETTAATATAEALLGKIVQARHDDVITVTYQDANPATSISKSARVDLEAPVVTLVSPVDGFFTNIATVTMSAEVTDAGAGVDQANIDLKINLGTTGLSRGAAVETPIENGYRVTAASEGTITEGEKKWFVGVMDKVGNVPDRDVLDSNKPEDCGSEAGQTPCGTGPVGVNEAPKGAGSNLDVAGNPFKFTVDTRAPTLTGGRTGISLKNPGVTSGNNAETEKKDQNTWVRVTFSTGDGRAPLDPSTVSASDFRVDDAQPLDVKVSTVNHPDGTATIAKGTAVYLQVGQMDSDARPEVELTGEVKDKAGNTRSEGRVASVSDGLAPKLTVTTSADLAKDSVTVTITSSENLRTNPTLELTETKPAKDDEGAVSLVSPISRAVSLQAGTLTTWTGTYKNASGQASKRYVAVTASDAAGNEAKKGFAASETDLVSFQVDSAAPELRFVDAAGKELKSTKQEEGAVWIVAEFDEDEHADDKYRTVAVTVLTLMDKDSEEVITEDVTQVFPSEVDCVDQDTGSDRYDADEPAMNNKCAQRILAIDLTPGMYNVAVTGVDQTGNEVTGNTDFEVTEAKPFELTLRPGQNFISIPGMPMDEGGNIDTLFSDEAISAVSTYDRSRQLEGMNPWLQSSKDLETGMFSGDITAIEPGKAYFVNSTASVIVKVKLQAAGQLPPTIPVRQGFNAIGFWSVSGDANAEIDLYLGSIGWSVAYTYDPTPGKGWEVIRKDETDAAGEPLSIVAGKGYLVYALYDAVLTP